MAEGRRLLVAGNWKMNGSKAMIAQFATGLEAVPGVDLVVLPPSIYLPDMALALAGTAIGYGAQDVHTQAAGAYTGDTAAAMVAEVGARWTIVGHSERRAGHGETDAVVADKLVAALAAGLEPMVCLGESLAQREAGEAEATVGRQLRSIAERAGAAHLSQAVIAYEPIWAIGTGVTATPEQAEDMHRVIREVLDELGAPAGSMTVLYGGSVNADNAAEIFAGENIDGALVGGASLKSDSFLAIARALAAAKHA
jgi:triosephosphate isomerase